MAQDPLLPIGAAHPEVNQVVFIKVSFTQQIVPNKDSLEQAFKALRETKVRGLHVSSHSLSFLFCCSRQWATRGAQVSSATLQVRPLPFILEPS